MRRMRWCGRLGVGVVMVCAWVLAGGGARASAAGAATAGAARGRMPNIVLILADDMGWRDVAVYGSRFYETPNLDRLAQRGMMFVNAYAANPLCSPTRASILTGQYPGRLRFTTPGGHLPRIVLDPVVPKRGAAAHKVTVPQSRTRLPLTYYTIAEALHDAGYSTAHFGKWHLGTKPYDPKNQGFDFNVPGGSFPGPPGGYFAPFKASVFRDSPAGEHIDDRLTREAIRWMEAHRDGPFFVNFWFFSVHAPQMGKPALVAKYRAKADPQSPQRNPIMGAMIETVDDCVGRLVGAIERLGLADDTVILFTSDNGGISWQALAGAPVTSNLPLRNGKASIYEGGTREPLIVVWPGVVKAGSRSAALVSTIDFFPTLLEMAGLARRPGTRLDGISFVRALKGGALGRDTLFCHFPHYVPKSGNLPSVWVRQGDWKLIRFFGDGPGRSDRFELYNLDEDIGETRNLAEAMPEKVRALDALITRHLAETGALVPQANPAYRPAAEGR